MNRSFSFGAAVLAALLFLAPSAVAQDGDAARRGEYLFRAGGCYSCHTDEKNKGPGLAGGRALETPFGTFYSPNITPDKGTGIGSWSDADFLRALKQGKRPDGASYFPVFPYATYNRMTDADALAIKAYLFSLPPVSQANKPHDVGFPFSWRFLQTGWRLLFFSPGEWKPDPSRDAAYNRGGYLVEALTHCQECHTPRNAMGGLKSSLAFAGTAEGPEGQTVPNITPDKDTGIGFWTQDDLAKALKTGETPNFSELGRSMREAIEHGLKYLSEADRQAIAAYILAQKPISHQVKLAK
jgi:mono/diheme cytochrome c family protein